MLAIPTSKGSYLLSFMLTPSSNILITFNNYSNIVEKRSHDKEKYQNTFEKRPLDKEKSQIALEKY